MQPGNPLMLQKAIQEAITAAKDAIEEVQDAARKEAIEEVMDMSCE